MRDAITSNLTMHKVEFGKALADCIESQFESLDDALENCWKAGGINFLKLFTVGLGKFLLQFYNAQSNHPADVVLASAFTYKVHGSDPDMLSLAFRISPKGLVVEAPSVGGTATKPILELGRAKQVAKKAGALWDIDKALATSTEVKTDGVNGTKKLLQSAGYDLEAWRAWLAELHIRPMEIGDIQ